MTRLGGFLAMLDYWTERVADRSSRLLDDDRVLSAVTAFMVIGIVLFAYFSLTSK